MKPITTAIIGGAAIAAALASCSNKVTITAEQSGAQSGSTGSTMMMTAGSGASGPGGTTGSGGAGTGGSSSSSTGTGAGAGKVVTADSDIAQYQSITVDLNVTTPLLAGPFFVTDVYATAGVTLSTVSGSDCSTPKTAVLQPPGSGGVEQIHGIRLPILAGQSLCEGSSPSGTVTILGFRPY